MASSWAKTWRDASFYTEASAEHFDADRLTPLATGFYTVVSTVSDQPPQTSKPAPSLDDAGATGLVTAQLRAWSRGDGAAGEQAAALLYAELRSRAMRYLRNERGGHVLQPTALVNEAFLRLMDLKQIDWRDRTHFVAMAATMMRRILVDHARGDSAAKRGGSRCRVPLREDTAAEPAPDVDLLDLNAALEELGARDAQSARVVELRYFGGLSIEETAAALDISTATVKREWNVARAWLLRRLLGGEIPPA
jgi:RNA polymerase sigma factor (TIGR02999 family)